MRCVALCYLPAVFLLLACGREPLLTVELPTAGLVLELPAGWQLQQASGQTLLFARPTEGGKAIPAAYLMLVRHPQRDSDSPVTLDSYVAFSELQARQYALGYASDTLDAVTIAGQAARRKLRNWKGHTREKRELSLMWVAAGYGYELTAVAAPEQFPRVLPRFERVMASLRPLGS